jgi:hypothetical protein
MSEPLERFLEREFKGKDLQKILDLLTEEGAEKVEHLYGVTEEHYKSMGIKTIQTTRIMSALEVSFNLPPQLLEI